MKVSNKDVLLPTTLVGSYPRPAFMTGPVFGAGVKDKEFPSYRMREFYRDAVTLAVKDMTDAGLDVVTEGAQHWSATSSRAADRPTWRRVPRSCASGSVAEAPPCRSWSCAAPTAGISSARW